MAQDAAPGTGEPEDDDALAHRFLYYAHSHLSQPSKRMEGEVGTTTHTVARDQLATAQVHALLALNATLGRLADLLGTEPESTVQVHVEADAPAAAEAAAQFARDQRRYQ